MHALTTTARRALPGLLLCLFAAGAAAQAQKPVMKSQNNLKQLGMAVNSPVDSAGGGGVSIAVGDVEPAAAGPKGTPGIPVSVSTVAVPDGAALKKGGMGTLVLGSTNTYSEGGIQKLGSR